MNDMREEGEAIGEARGMMKGEAKKARETARNLIAMGLSHSDIAKATGLSLSEIEQLN